jgi:hypothetical protein
MYKNGTSGNILAILAAVLLRRGGGGVLQRIVTGDGTWVHHYDEHTRKYQSTEWKYASSPSGVHSAGKVMLTQFWGFNGPILEHYQDRGQMDNSARYCAMFEETLKPSNNRGLPCVMTTLHLIRQQ